MKNQDSDKKLVEEILSIPSESQTLEFKRLAEKKVAIKTIETVVAMANTEGGVIILGVSDPEKTESKGEERIFSIDEKIDVFDALGREIQRIIPPLSRIWPPKIISADENKRIGLLFVPKAIFSFHSINNHVYVRAEKSNRQLDAHEVVKFAYAKGFEKADKGLVDIDFSLLKTLFFQEWKEARKINGGSIESVLAQLRQLSPQFNRLL